MKDSRGPSPLLDGMPGSANVCRSSTERIAVLAHPLEGANDMEMSRDTISRKNAVPGFFEVASSGPVVKRALGYLVVVGGILIAINHGDALVRGDLDSVRVFKMILTPLVPYLVSTLSSVSAIRSSFARDAVEPDSA